MKVKCVSYERGERFFTIGKVYDLKDGKITNDNGYTYEQESNAEILAFLSDWYRFKKVEETIVIYSEGKKVIALDKATGKKAIARCCPEDEFDFYTGARLAFNRLVGVEGLQVVKQDKYDIGDKVLIVKEWNKCTNENATGRMDKWLGKIMTIKNVTRNRNYRMIEDADENGNIGWRWNKHCIVGKVIDESVEQKKPEVYNGRIVFGKGSMNITAGKIYEIENGYIELNVSGKFPISDPFKNINDVKQYFSESGRDGKGGNRFSFTTYPIMEIEK